MYKTHSPTVRFQKPQPTRLWLFILFLILALSTQDVLSAESLSICQIQGSGKTTPHAGEQVQTEGVVTADFDDQSERGFFIQQENCDGDDTTSDGIFVYLNEMANVVNVGDWVAVDGIVEEDFGLTRINTTPAGLGIVSSGNPLPQAVDFAPPFDNLQSDSYFEARESMLVQAADTVVVGPTNARGDAFVVRAGLGLDRVFHDDPAGTGEVIPVGQQGVYQIEPDAQVGDQISNLVGVLNFTGGEFGLMLTGFPTLIRPGLEVPLTLHERDSDDLRLQVSGTSPFVPFSIATLNLHNLFDTVDDPNTDDSVPTASEYQTKLKKLALTIHDGLGEPLLIAVQEAENNAVLQALVNRPEIQASYAFIWEDSPDTRGIDVALLYQSDRVSVLSYEYRQGCTTLVDGLGPDGNGDVQKPANALTCDTDGDGENDGNRLFSRPPLLARMQVCEPIIQNLRNGVPVSERRSLGCGGAVRDLWIIAVHLKSKSEDTDTIQYTLPRRLAQAQFVAGLYTEVVGSDPGAEVIALGDFNDFPNSQPMATLTGAGLTNLMPNIPHASAYTYIFQGVSQILDHVLVSPSLIDNPDEGLFPSILHLNADYPVSWETDDSIPRRASDHEPVLVNVILLPYSVWLPVIMQP